MSAIVLAALVAAAATLAGVWQFRRRAARWGLLDVPNSRSLHVTPVPRGAGLVIGLVVIATVLILSVAGLAGPPKLAATYAAATLAVLILGWLDDRWSLPARDRLAIQVAIALAAALALGWQRDQIASAVPSMAAKAVVFAVTVIWLVGLVNAYNFMDGIDGLAAGQAVIAAVCWIVVGRRMGAPFTIAAATVVAASSAAFLFHNWSPARVFLGDAGSNFLGLSFALLPLTLYTEAAAGRLPVAAVLFVGVFLIDTVFTFIRRLVSGENVLQAHRTHLYQRLIACGYSHHAVAIWWLALAAVSGAAGVLYLAGGSAPGAVVTVAAVAAAMFGSVRAAEARSSAGIVNRS